MACEVTLKLADGTEKHGSYATCVGVLNLMDKLGVEWTKVKGDQTSFSVRDGGTLVTSLTAHRLLTVGTGKAFAKRLAIRLAPVAKAKAKTPAKAPAKDKAKAKAKKTA